MFWVTFGLLLLTCVTVFTFLFGLVAVVCACDESDGIAFVLGCVLLIVACAGGAGLITAGNSFDNNKLVEAEL